MKEVIALRSKGRWNWPLGLFWIQTGIKLISEARNMRYRLYLNKSGLSSDSMLSFPLISKRVTDPNHLGKHLTRAWSRGALVSKDNCTHFVRGNSGADSKLGFLKNCGAHLLDTVIGAQAMLFAIRGDADLRRSERVHLHDVKVDPLQISFIGARRTHIWIITSKNVHHLARHFRVTRWIDWHENEVWTQLLGDETLFPTLSLPVGKIIHRPTWHSRPYTEFPCCI
jgi:hypothetical protein